MKRLGYSRWVAQGGDWGSGVTHALGHVRLDGLVAAHVNWPLVFPEKFPENPTPSMKDCCVIANALRLAPYDFLLLGGQCWLEPHIERASNLSRVVEPEVLQYIDDARY